MTDTSKEAAWHALMNYQQADEDGIMVLVSRQAIHECRDERDALRAQLQAARDEALEEAAEVATVRAEFWLKEHKGSTPYSDASGTAIAKNGEAHDIAFNIRALKSTSAEGDG